MQSAELNNICKGGVSPPENAKGTLVRPFEFLQVVFLFR